MSRSRESRGGGSRRDRRRQERLASRDLAERERREAVLKKTRFVFSFSRHVTWEDAGQVSRLLRRGDVDIFVPEVAGVRRRFTDVLQQVADGEVQMPEDPLPGFEGRYVTELYKTGIKIVFVDVPEYSAIAQWWVKEGIPMIDRSVAKLFESQDETEALELARSFLNDFKKNNEQREAVIHNGLVTKVPDVIMANPALASKEHITVLVQLGSAHRHLTEALQNSDQVESVAVHEQKRATVRHNVAVFEAAVQQGADQMSDEDIFFVMFGVIISKLRIVSQSSAHPSAITTAATKLISIGEQILRDKDIREAHKMLNALRAIDFQKVLPSTVIEPMG